MQTLTLTSTSKRNDSSSSLLMLGLAAALARCAFTFLLGGAWVEMILAFFGAGIGNAVRCKRSKHYLTLVLCTRFRSRRPARCTQAVSRLPK